MKRKFAVIGLGRFGTTIALELARQGHEVLAVDQDRRRVDDVVDRVRRRSRSCSDVPLARKRC